MMCRFKPSLRAQLRRGISRVARCLMLSLAVAAPVAPEGAAAQPLSVGQDANGQLELFRLSASGSLSHRWRRAANGAWSSWCALGGSFKPGIAVVSDAAGAIEVFGIDQASGNLAFARQLGTNCLEWSDWVSLGGTFLPPVAAVRNAEGRIEVFAVDADSHHLKHVYQADTAGGWSAWADMGGRLGSGLAVGTNIDGRLELFGLAADGGELLHRWQLQPETVGEWSDWVGLGQALQPGLAIGQDKPGRLEVFGVSLTNGEALRINQAAPGDSTNWAAWIDFGGNLKPELAVGQCAFGRLELLAVNATNSMLMHCWELYTNTWDQQWSAWAELGEKCQGGPAVASDADGDLEVFAADPVQPDLIHHRRQFSSSNAWLDWSTLDHPVFSWLSRLWQVDEGLPDNLVQAIAQTSDGFLWVGTRGGLARFDGYQFLCYDPQNTPELKSASITALCADRAGALWIGTDGGGLVRLKNGVFSRFSKTNGMAGDAIQVICESHDGTLWIGTTTGMSRFRDGVFHNYSVREGLLSDVVRCIYDDREGGLWIATGRGLNRLTQAETMDAFPMPNGLPNDSARSICEDRGGRIWIGSNNGLLWYESFWKTAFYAYNTKYGLSDTFVSAICDDGEGNLWVGTYSGLDHFRNGWFYSQLDGDGQPFDRVNALCVDREGNLWVGSKDGLSRLTQKKFFTYTKQQGLTHNNTMSVMQDNAGSMWIGTWGGGLDELRNEKVTAFTSTNGVSQDLILSLGAARDGSVWAGADFDGGLTRLKNGRLTHYTSKDGVINAGLRVLHEDAASNLWLGTDSGMGCFANGKFVTNRVTARLAGIGVRDISEDRSGGLWFATQNGLHYWQGKQMTAFTVADGLSDNSLNALLLDTDGTLWIGTSGGGLIRCRNGAFTSYTQWQGLFSNEIFGILDDQGWLWMSCSKGIFRVRKRDLDALDLGNIKAVTSLVYGKNDGMESPQCNGNGKPSAWKSADGHLWFPTSKGLVTVDPKTVAVDTEPPPVFIENVVADAKTVAEGRANLAGPTTVLGARTEPLSISPGHGQLEFQYAALDFSSPEKTRFKYRLEGVDAGWIDAGGRRVAYYNNIAPGSYQFDVIACNQGGGWSAPGASLSVILRPHYWQTVWFRALLAVGIVGGATGMGLYGARRRMQRKFARLEQMQAVERERGRIAKDMHDQIGAGLTQIGLLGEFARRDAVKNRDVKTHVEKICDMARELARTLDEIVWMVNPKNDTLNKLGIYLAAYAEDYFHATDIRCRLDIPPSLPAYPLPTEVRHNVFLTVQEALNNIAKHSRATEARLSFILKDSRLEINVVDDGIGFQAAAASTSRYGISNMRERILAIGGSFEIASGKDAGTKICLRIPIQSEPAGPNID